MSDFIPNSFQVPNAYVDRVWHLLTPQEQSVLIYMARRIFGFGKREDRISLSQFTGGIRSRKDGRMLDGGTGLGADAVRRALAGLVEFGLASELAPATHSEGPLYSLQLDDSCLDKAGLEERKKAKTEAARERTRDAREKSGVCRTEGVGVCPTEGRGSVGQTHNKQWENQKEKQDLPNNQSDFSGSHCYREGGSDFDFSDDLFAED